MILSGKEVADEILALVTKTISDHQLQPLLAVVQVGTDPASEIYVKQKMRVAESVGIRVELLHLATASTDELIAHIQTLNARVDVNAILVQLPLPQTIDSQTVISAIDPRKDVDGFHPENITAYTSGRAAHTPVLVQAVEWLMAKTSVPLKEKNAVIIGKSDVFLQPLTYMLSKYGAQVSWTRPPDIDRDAIKNADVLVVAVGSPYLITGDMIKAGAIVIDIGINRMDNGSVIGDVAFEGAVAHAG